MFVVVGRGARVLYHWHLLLIFPVALFHRKLFDRLVIPNYEPRGVNRKTYLNQSIFICQR